MVTELLIPKPRIVVPKPPSYLKLAMAFALGEGTKLGDKSRYRSHGTITRATWATGLHGKCLDFSPSPPSYVEIPAAHTHLDFTSEDFSIIARVYVDTLTFNRNVFERATGTTKGYYFQINTDGTFGFYTFQAAALQYSGSSAGAIVVSTWYTIGISRDGASVKVYKNGGDDTTTVDVHIDPVTCPEDAYIGYNFHRTQSPFDGKIEFLRVFGGIAFPASTHLAWHNALK